MALGRVSSRAHRAFFKGHAEIGQVRPQDLSVGAEGDRLIEALSLHACGIICFAERASFADARRYFEAAREVASAAGLLSVSSRIHAWLGMVNEEEGHVEMARELYRRSCASARRCGDARYEAHVLLLRSAAEAKSADIGLASAVLSRVKQAAKHDSDAAIKAVPEIQSVRIDLVRSQRCALEGRPSEARDILDRAIGQLGALKRGSVTRLLQASPELRFVVRMLDREIAECVSAKPVLHVESDGSAFQWAEQDIVDMPRGAVIRRVFATLVAERSANPGRALDTEVLLARCWPGERVLPDAGALRVRQVMTRLRRLGLGDVLLRRDDGYLLDPAVPVVAPGDPPPVE